MVASKRRPSARRSADDLPRVEVSSRAEWRRWLAAHAERASGVWLVTYKKAADAKRYLCYDDIVEEALCFGWVDSLPRSLDASRSMRLVTPRRPSSAWSAINKSRVERLAAEKKMTPAGLGVIARAKADGSWSKLDAVEALVVPSDLRRALALHKPAADRFEAFPRSSKRVILEWIAAARSPTTRAKRIEETARLAAKDERANHWRRSRLQSFRARAPRSGT